jgi:glycosyltransferase involved in cell wall biosynthesis
VKDLKTLVVTEGLALPLDEGGTISTVKMIESLPRPVLLLNRTNGTTPPTAADVRQFPAGHSRVARVFLYLRFAATTLSAVIRYRPAQVVYVPLRNPPVALQVHAAALALLARDFVEVLFQVTRPSRLFALVSRFRIRVFSAVDQQMLTAAGIRAECEAPPFNRRMDRRYDRQALRKEYGVPADAFVVTHVGHYTPWRGLDTLAGVAEREPSMTFLLILSSRVPVGEPAFPANVIVINRQIEDVHEVYAMSDAYFFPLRSHVGAVSTPLTLLEASEARVPIVCSDLPTLRSALADYENVAFVDNDASDAVARFAQCLDKLRSATRAQA